jgi:hypothetical protein
MTDIKVGDLIKTKVWFGIIIKVIDNGPNTGSNYLVHWFFDDNRNPVSWLDGYAALKYRINVLTAVGK